MTDDDAGRGKASSLKLGLALDYLNNSMTLRGVDIWTQGAQCAPSSVSDENKREKLKGREGEATSAEDANPSTHFYIFFSSSNIH